MYIQGLSKGYAHLCAMIPCLLFASGKTLETISFDIDFINFSTRILINRFNRLETFILSLIYRNQRSGFILEFKVIFASI